MLNKVLEGFGYAAIAASMEKSAGPVRCFFSRTGPQVNSLSIHYCFCFNVFFEEAHYFLYSSLFIKAVSKTILAEIFNGVLEI